MAWWVRAVDLAITALHKALHVLHTAAVGDEIEKQFGSLH